MRLGTLVSALILIAVALVMPSCGGIVSNPSPSITSLSPPSRNAGDPGFTLMVNGSGFAPQSSIVWNGVPRSTMFLAGNQLTTQIAPTDLTNPGPVPVQVTTPSPGGGTSGVINFMIIAVPSPVPQVSSISPSGTFAGGSGLTITVTGSKFVSTSTATICFDAACHTRNNLQTFVINSTTLQATIPSTDITAACGPPTMTNCPQIGVLNPAPGGGVSPTTVTLSINNPPPLLATLSPTATPAGASSAVTLTINAVASAGNSSGFDMASVVHFGAVVFDGLNMDPKTTFVNSTQLTISIPTADLAAAGTVPVFVVNPAPGGGTSPSLPFGITPTSKGGGLPELVDVALDGTQANNGIGDPTTSGPVMDATGEFIAFASISDNLVSRDMNGAADIFFRDTCLGATASCTPATTLVSVASAGGSANGASTEPSMDGAGKFVAFTSTALNLVSTATLTGNKQVYVRCPGVRSGCAVATTLVSVDVTDSTKPANGDASQPAISPDGRFVAFVSAASNLVKGVTPAAGVTQIYLRDTCNGAPASCKASTILVSSPDRTTPATTPADGTSNQPTVGMGGQFISFTSTAANLGTSNPSGAQEIFVRNTCLGVSSGCTPITSLVSSPDVTTPPTTLANGPSAQSAISSNGRFITFASKATNVCSVAAACPVLNGTQQIFLRDSCAGVATGCMPSTSLISIAKDGTTAGNALSERPAINSTGQFVGFASLATNLVTASTNGVDEQIFVRNTCTGASGTCTASTALVSVSAPMGMPPAPVVGNATSVNPALSSAGHFVSFISFASNLVAIDTNGADDVFLANTTF